MKEPFKLATFALSDGFGTRSKLTVSICETDLSVIYSLGAESLSNLGGGVSGVLPDYIDGSAASLIRRVKTLLDKKSHRNIAGETLVSPVVHEFDKRTAQRINKTAQES